MTTKNKQIVGIEAHDSFELGTARTITNEGFLEAPATIARAGVQLYRAGELGLDRHGMSPNQIVRLHRPSEELFRPETVASFHSKPVINGTHKTITADNWKDHAVGDIFDPQPSDTTLKVGKFSVKDKSAIADINSGKKFLSIGYKFDIDLTPGTTATGDQYDGVQRNIIGNHVLITATPRGGPVCAIADTATVEQGERKMRKVTVNGVPVEVGDSEAGIIEALQGQLTAAQTKPSTITYLGAQHVGDSIIKLIEGKDAEIKTLTESKLTDAQIEERVASRVAVVGDASKLVANFDAKGKSNKQIFTETLTTVMSGDETTKAVVSAILGGKTIGDSSEESLGTAFRAVAASKPAAKAVTGGDSVLANALLSVAAVGDNGTTVVATGPTGREGFIARQNSAWQKK